MVKTQIQNGIAHLSIDMPGRSMNVLEPAVAAALSAAFESVLADAGVQGIVISSAKGSFIAGADLAQMEALAAPGVSLAQAAARIAYLGDFFRRIETCGKPVVAAASGTALGGGLELMLACHYRIAADHPKAQFGLPEVKLGLLPGAGGTQRVPRLIGIQASIGLLTGGAPLSAREAQKLGLLNEVVPAEQLLAAAEAAIREGRVPAQAPWDVKGYKLPGGEAYAPANAAALMSATSRLHAATRGNEPAPLTILRCIHDGSKLPIARALKLEQKYFATLVQGRVAQNLIRTQFFAKQAADKLSRRPAAVAKSSVKRLGVLGAGFMGQGIAQVSLAAGIEVVLVDRELAIAQRARDGIAATLQADVDKGRLKPEAREAQLARLHCAADHGGFAGCELVIEAVLEDFAVKAQATRLTEAQLADSAIFASNTSALPIDELAAASVRPANFIGLHFFSPVPKMALVEIIIGAKTSDETLARALDYCQQIRKTPIVVRDGYGFYTTRCVDAYVREGIRLLADGVAPALIENAGVALGMPVGPLALADEVGIDVLHHIAHFFASREHGAWAEDRHAVPNAQIDALYAAGRYGRKRGAGFYDYPAGGAKQLAVSLPRNEVQPDMAAVRERLLYAQLVEAARCWAENVVEDLREADLGATLGWAFPRYLGGPFAAIEDIGLASFVQSCATLSRTLGPRFELPARLRERAAVAQHLT
ncbi:3-hydroxyacyl-CoA dehydrogenase [Solimonas aquatica]|uniref:enoyl-CoA hydratase n=1 Tax=Solimonas aquatica TaxID=489703 RepID=A0A1H9GB69_9GAMM|nr:3-hydroxyacyl-CoA dehydrogenase NAD-binding domain-containing protein [Solimonas aquatica]SEQ47324.1 3-hydroxyacyl-CoA dehydrogenase [Solimonas aquatica]